MSAAELATPSPNLSEPTRPTRRHPARSLAAALGLAWSAAACTQPSGPPTAAHPRVSAPTASVAAGAPKPAASLEPCARDAEDACRRRCQEGDGESCARWGVVRGRRGEATEDLLGVFLRACDAGSGRGCNGAGYLLERGVDGRVDLDRSLALYERATQLGYVPAHYNVGQRYRDGVGVPIDAGRACRAYETGCDLGDPDGCYMAGAMRAQGECGASVNEARGLVERACAMESSETVRHRAEACSLLETLNARGPGAPPDRR